jgi:uncharacterized protein (TIGR02270 family)
VTAPRLAYLPDVLALHFDELQHLWARRRVAVRSPEHAPRDVAALDERIAAHLQGLLVVPGPARALAEPALLGEDRDAAFAAATVLLRLDAPAAAAVVHAIAAAAPAGRRGIAEALGHAPAAAVQPHEAALAAMSETGAMAAALEALAFRGTIHAGHAAAALAALLDHEDAALRAAGWRTAAYLGAALEARHYAAAIRDETPGLRAVALDAAAWARVPGALAYGRQCAERPTLAGLDGLRMFAVLAGPEDARRTAAALDGADLGAERLALLGTLGVPASVDAVIAAMDDADPATAAAAGAAFARLTGHDVTSPRTASTAAADADPFDAEFADVVALPDPERARAVWSRVRDGVAGAGRLCRGLDVARPLDGATAAGLDMASRRDCFLRARYYGAWDGGPALLEAFPMAR